VTARHLRHLRIVQLRFPQLEIGLVVAVLLVAFDGRGFAATRVVLPCAPGTSDHREATAAFAVLDQRIRGLDDAAPVKDLVDQLSQLAGSRCFALSTEDPSGVPTTTSSRALRVWWSSGGASWLHSYLEADARLRLKEVVLPPEISASLIPGQVTEPEVAPALAQLMCPATDRLCGVESRGFRRRAELFFAARRSGFFDDPCRDHPPDVSNRGACAKASRSGYKAWRRCLDGQRDRTPDLPLGDSKSPAGGWLQINRVGDTAETSDPSCHRVRLFHVDSGSVYLVDACPGKPESSVVGGRVPTQVVRETLWMLMLAKHVRFRQRQAQTEYLPAGLVPAWPIKIVTDGGIEEGIRGGCAGGVVHDTTITWEWLAPAPVAGEFRLAGSPGGAYADTLIQVLDSSFDPQAPTEPLPRDLLARARVGR
jgi:hypothetical protein